MVEGITLTSLLGLGVVINLHIKESEIMSYLFGDVINYAFIFAEQD